VALAGAVDLVEEEPRVGVVPADVSGETASCAAIAKHAATRANSFTREGRFPCTHNNPAIFSNPVLPVF
jgi:hypothetical protein